jgi:hypothetical protein
MALAKRRAHADNYIKQAKASTKNGRANATNCLGENRRDC